MSTLPLPSHVATTTFAAAAPAGGSMPEELEQAFQALLTYDRGSNRGSLAPIDDAVVESLQSREQRLSLERRLIAALKEDLSSVATQFICGKLTLVGSDASVPALDRLLNRPELSHSARSALEAIGSPEAVRRLRESLRALRGALQIGVVQSLGRLRDDGSIAALANFLDQADAETALASAGALGRIASQTAGAALGKPRPDAPAALKRSIAEARLLCAERRLEEGKKEEALAIYRELSGPEHSKPIQLAAKRGMLMSLQAR